MEHKAHREFNEDVFRQVCNEALEDLPAVAGDERVDWETKHIAVLEHLLRKIRGFCGVYEVTIRDLTGIPRSSQLRQEIIDVIEHDSLTKHQTSSFFHKAPIVEEYVQKAIGTES